MVNDTVQSKLLHNLFTLLGAHRPAFKQVRPFWRAIGLVLGEIFSFGRHTVTQGLLSLGVTEADWNAWTYAVLLLAAFRTWGLCSGPPTPARWWPGAKRWSSTTLWRAYRSDLWSKPEFRPFWATTGANWWKKETWFAALANAPSRLLESKAGNTLFCASRFSFYLYLGLKRAKVQVDLTPSPSGAIFAVFDGHAHLFELVTDLV